MNHSVFVITFMILLIGGYCIIFYSRLANLIWVNLDYNNRGHLAQLLNLSTHKGVDGASLNDVITTFWYSNFSFFTANKFLCNISYIKDIFANIYWHFVACTFFRVLQTLKLIVIIGKGRKTTLVLLTPSVPNTKVLF